MPGKHRGFPTQHSGRASGADTGLPARDRLEGFHPGGSSLYRLILPPVFTLGLVSMVRVDVSPTLNTGD
jgi:hypothetical protein